MFLCGGMGGGNVGDLKSPGAADASGIRAKKKKTHQNRIDGNDEFQ